MQKVIPVHRLASKILLAVVGFFVLVLAPTACSSKQPVAKEPTYEAVGLASFYGQKFHGRRTASGEPYDMHAMTAAHRRLKFGTMVEVTNLNNGRTVTVRINDRGPFVKGRIIDLSHAAAKSLGMLSQGVAKVSIRVMQ